MALKYLISSLTILGLSACASAAQNAAPSELDDALGFLTGACWNGEFSDGQSTDTQCFRPVYGGLFVRSNHLVEGALGPYGGETLFSWNDETGRVEYTYWDTSGGISRGTMIPTDWGLQAPDETYESPDGSSVVISSRWEILSAESWRQSVEEVSGDNRRTLWEITYTRAELRDWPAPSSAD
ncbi:hypothetical protein [Hyphobacterium sp.]|uniref:hypothetical protein n=1 Tax=Hyphobacterium sp. TaxID=2004662 RepID=UPI0037487D6F